MREERRSNDRGRDSGDGATCQWTLWGNETKCFALVTEVSIMCYHNDFMKLNVRFQPHFRLTIFPYSSWVTYRSWVSLYVRTDHLRRHYFGGNTDLGGLWTKRRGWYRCLIYSHIFSCLLISALTSCESAVTVEYHKNKRILVLVFSFKHSSKSIPAESLFHKGRKTIIQLPNITRKRVLEEHLRNIPDNHCRLPPSRTTNLGEWGESHFWLPSYTIHISTFQQKKA